MDTISLKQLIDWMDMGQEFSIAFVTLNKKERTGGQWIELPKCQKHNYLTAEQRRLQKRTQPTEQLANRNPNHFQNSTRNIRVIGKGDIIKIHLRLIRRFNGKIVV
jgi:hypothetical protein